jgi:hypothetical protein
VVVDNTCLWPADVPAGKLGSIQSKAFWVEKSWALTGLRWNGPGQRETHGALWGAVQRHQEMEALAPRRASDRGRQSLCEKGRLPQLKSAGSWRPAKAAARNQLTQTKPSRRKTALFTRCKVGANRRHREQADGVR